MNPRKKKSEILDKATETFLSNVRKVEKAVWRFFRELLAKLDRTGGKIDNSNYNLDLLLSLDRDLVGVFTEGSKASLSKYLANFDRIEQLNRLMYRGFLSQDMASRVSRLVFSVERTILVDNVTRGLTAPALIRDQMIQPLRKLLYQGIVFSQPIQVLRSNLRKEILTQEGSKSKLLRYTQQISQDAISQFDGAINDRIRDEVGLDGFYYIGSLIRSSRANCNELVTGTGRFKHLAVEPGLYRTADLPEIISLARGRSGWNENTTPETFAQYRGGYSCRHEVVYVPLEDEEAVEKAGTLQ